MSRLPENKEFYKIIYFVFSIVLKMPVNIRNQLFLKNYFKVNYFVQATSDNNGGYSYINKNLI